jgi:hypothetical protein
MRQDRFSKVLGDVSREFDRPHDIVVCGDLSLEQKIRLLKEWEIDLRELQVASEENMTGENASGSTAELLRQCRRALAMLGMADGDSGGAPTKQGGA